ncbi:MAG: hypothetical protein Q9160_006535 [Pyrenula sp. 1 TL-2023]
MANAAATSALATEVVGVQRLWYKTSPGPANSIFLMLSSQLLGISIFCLSNRNSLLFTYLFGGTQGNEGLGFLSWCMDFNYIGTTTLWLPLQTIANNLVGYLGCVAIFMGVYYANTWRARDFPFLSQLMFDGKLSSPESYVKYDQNNILNGNGELDRAKLESYGLPYLSSTYVTSLVTGNMAVTAALMHMILWNYDDLKSAWSFMSVANLRRLLKPGTWSLGFWRDDGSGEHSKDIMEDDNTDPHYKLTAAFKDVPNWWFGIVLFAAFVTGLVVIYTSKSSLPWWGYLISLLVGSIFVLFFGALVAISGFTLKTQPVKTFKALHHARKPLT